MAIQAPLFSENMSFSGKATSQDWMGAIPWFGLPDPFIGLVQPMHVNGPISAGLLDKDGRVVASSSPSSPPAPSDVNILPFGLSRALSDEVERQRREIDLFLQFQNDTLRCRIEEQKKQEISALLSSFESKTLAKMEKTEQDLAKVRSKTRELEDCLKRAEAETEAWQRMAQENEARVMGLNNMLGQIKERLRWAAGSLGPAQDAESACGGEDDKLGKIRCKWCKSQVSCLVLLPCRHLCACRECGSLLELCPVCEAVKEGSIEVGFI